MEIDSTNLAVLDKAAKKGEVDLNKAIKIVDGFYKGVVHVIETEQTVIKIPFFGKFMYSNAWKDKKKQIAVKYSELIIIN